MSDDQTRADAAINALAGEDDVIAEVQDAVRDGLKPQANPDEALLKVNDAVEAREEIAAGRRVLGRDETRFGSVSVEPAHEQASNPQVIQAPSTGAAGPS